MMIEWEGNGRRRRRGMGRKRGRGGENRYLIFKSYSFFIG
jgi:hypothetical protein